MKRFMLCVFVVIIAFTSCSGGSSDDENPISLTNVGDHALYSEHDGYFCATLSVNQATYVDYGDVDVKCEEHGASLRVTKSGTVKCDGARIIYE